MLESHVLLQQQTWRFIDHSISGLRFHPIETFAYDDTFCTSVGYGQSAPIIRTWVHSPTIVLGMQDVRMPFIEKGIKFLQEKGYVVIVRNSGGLAVVLDEGIVNISLILPEGKGMDIVHGYEAMWNLIQWMLEPFAVKVEAGEIKGSYCPGSFDLSIHGKKFAGISQRRLRGGVAVQIYICTEGSGSNRADIIKEFYQQALQNETMTFAYPTIIPTTMASLQELIQNDMSVEQIVSLTVKALKNIGSEIIASTALTPFEKEWYPYHYRRMIERNKQVVPGTTI